MANAYDYGQQGQEPQQRARPRSRIMSWGGNKQMGGEEYRPPTQESPRDKARYSRNLTTHADPSKAIHEVEPGQEQFAQSTMESLRGMQHLDFQGNVITDADRSNPTRPRLERPLDTIRSFEAAADGRKYDGRPDTSMSHGGDRRSGYYQGYGGSRTPQPRMQDDGYGGRGYSGHPAVNGNYGHGRGGLRPDSAMDHGYSPSPAPSRGMPRNVSDPALHGQNGHYGYQNQYETATNGSGSGHSYGTEPWANSTDPSSVNSSVDRLAGAPPPPPKHDMSEPYGQYGYGGGHDMQQHPIMEEGYGHRGYGGQHDAYGYDQNGYVDQYGGDAYGNGAGMVPPPPPHSAKPNMPRQPSKLQSSRRASTNRQQDFDDYGISPGGGDEKRKSWLKRRFSKNNG